MKQPEFIFELTSEAAEKNFLVLRQYGLDLGKALSAQRDTPLEYGSEFREPSVLEPLLSMHPLWPKMKAILQNGSLFPVTELDEETRLADLEAALARGNHKGASEKLDLLMKLVTKDVIHGYAMALPLNKLPRIPGVVLAPVNIQAQNTINEFGEIIAKDRLTHDQSFDFSPDSSVNSRVIAEELLPVRYGHCIRRIINWVVAARRKYPGVKIFACKVDYKSAFRRIHLAWKTALQTCTHLPEAEIAILALRLTFGGSPCPAEWSAISELANDLTTAIMQHPDWDPSELFSPLISQVPPRSDLPDDVPFGVGKELVVDVPVNSKGMSEIYVDDKLSCALDLPGSDHVDRCAGAALLSIHTIARPLSSHEPIPRETMAAIEKLLAEAGPEELKIMLGWHLNFRTLIISLPFNKAKAWSTEISEILSEGKTKAKRLERNIGRFVNIGMILPYVHHFLARLRTLLKHAKKRKSAIPLPPPVQEDLKLMQKVIVRAQNGIDMNNLAYRMPNIVYRNDSCPFGLGGYDVRASGWRWIIPPELRFRATNNLLEHLANIVSIKLGLLDGSIKKGDCVLSMSDSIVSCSWLKKSNFDEEPDIQEDGTVKMDPLQAEVRAEVAREHALTMMENEICEYPQWFPGVQNVVADALSRDDDRDDETLTNLLLSHFPDQCVADLCAAEVAREGAVTRGTHEDQDRAWKRFCQYTKSIGIHDDTYLDNFDRYQRIRIMCAFAQAMREGRFSGPSYETLVESTIRNAVSYVAATFRDNDRRNPTLDEDGELARLLSRQFRAYRNKDPPVKQQKAIPTIVIKELTRLQQTELQKAVAQLAVGAFFFAMRSCEYLKVPQAEKRRTDILRLRNIRFFRNGVELPHSHPQLETAEVVSITFEKQKKDEKMDTVNQLASGDAILCPKYAWASIVKRIRSYPGTNDDTPVSTVMVNGRLTHVTSKILIDALEGAIEAVGNDRIGIQKGEIGTHSIRSGAAMAMYLGEVPVYTIMMLGRWSSDAFLRYIRKQVEQFSHNVSRKMILHQFHRHVPQIDRTISRDDPRQRNHPQNEQTR
eukprot:scaffold103894_cov40-Cyclotella_meneghiniana.AAC.3